MQTATAAAYDVPMPAAKNDEETKLLKEQGKRLLECVSELPYSRAQFAREIGTYASTISNAINGKRGLSPLMLSKAAEKLGVTLDWLIAGKEPKKSGAVAPMSGSAPMVDAPDGPEGLREFIQSHKGELFYEDVLELQSDPRYRHKGKGDRFWWEMLRILREERAGEGGADRGSNSPDKRHPAGKPPARDRGGLGPGSR
jgi:transcriptional regulator with XRE-family HTH domain